MVTSTIRETVGIEWILVDGQRLDIKAAARKQAGHARQHAEFVFDQNRYRMTWHLGGVRALMAADLRGSVGPVRC